MSSSEQDEVVEIETVADALAAAPFFTSASRKGVARLADRTTLEHYESGATIFTQGDPSREVFVVRNGHVAISTRDPSGGGTQVQSTLGPQALFGELGVLAGRARTATAVTTEATELWKIAGESFVELFSSEPVVAIEVVTSLARYVLDSEGVAEDLLFLDLQGRVAKRLLFLAGVRDGQPMPGLLDEIQIEMSELAALAGGTRIAVKRIIEDLVADGALAQNGTTLIILQPDVLEAVSQT